LYAGEYYLKKFVVLALTCLVIATAFLGVVLLSQNGDSKKAPVNSNSLNKTYDVNITEFKFTSTWGTPAGVTAAIGFNITLQNLENKDLNGLSLEVKMFDANGSEIQTQTLFYGPGILGHGAQIEPFNGILHAKENRTTIGEIDSDWNTVNNAYALGPITTIASIKTGNETLDERKFTA
jgi:hypothetical protein